MVPHFFDVATLPKGVPVVSSNILDMACLVFDAYASHDSFLFMNSASHLHAPFHFAAVH